MNKTILICFGLIALTLAGCIGDNDDTGTATPSVPDTPSYNNTQPASVTGLDFVAQLTDDNGTPFPSAGGIWTYGDYVFGSGLGAGFFIADVHDPTHPELLWNTTRDSVTAFSRDADVVPHPDGTLSLVLATQNDGMHVWDVTDPSAPVFLARILDDVADHNLAVIPGTELVFNSRSGGEGSTNDLVDLSDPGNPVVLGTYGTHGCHDISFHGTFGAEKFRAYCAGIDRTEIWDLDGLDTEAEDFGIQLVSVIDCDMNSPDGIVACFQDSPVAGNDLINTIGYPVRTLHHLAIVNDDASVLIIGDEHNGGGSPGVCLYYDETTGTSTPLGALWFYDISDETDPILMSWLSPPTVAADPPVADPTVLDPTNPAGVLGNLPSCTAHFGTFVPGEDKVVMSWYYAGVVLIDFSDLRNPVILDQYQPDGVFTWDSRVHGGYVFTGDISRGMDVLRLV